MMDWSVEGRFAIALESHEQSIDDVRHFSLGASLAECSLAETARPAVHVQTEDCEHSPGTKAQRISMV